MKRFSKHQNDGWVPPKRPTLLVFARDSTSMKTADDDNGYYCCENGDITTMTTNGTAEEATTTREKKIQSEGKFIHCFRFDRIFNDTHKQHVHAAEVHRTSGKTLSAIDG